MTALNDLAGWEGALALAAAGLALGALWLLDWLNNQ